MVCVDWRVDGQVGPWFHLRPFVSYVALQNGAAADCRAGTVVSCTGPVDAALSYRFRPGRLSAAVPADRHEAGLTARVPITRHSAASLDARFYGRADGYRSIRAETGPVWSFDSVATVTPLVSVYGSTTHATDVRWGVRHELRLFPKVSCVVRVEVPFETTNMGETIIDVRSAFYF
jgi:hypothetical protein